MYTYQDFEQIAEKDKPEFCLELINNYKTQTDYQIARDADMYDHQHNTTIENYVKTLFSSTGTKIIDTIATNNKISSNFFRRLNVQRNTYSLGNGVTFNDQATKEKLGKQFDTMLKKAGYFALIHGVSYVYWNFDHINVFKCTEFVPLFDSYTGALRAGVRFWQLGITKPIVATLYEVDGYTKMQTDDKGSNMKIVADKQAYIEHVAQSVADGEQVVGTDNYTELPIVTLYGSDLKQSTLVGMKESIDNYDLIRSGFANDISDCTQIYWVIKNAGGMNDKDLDKLRTRLKLTHVLSVDTGDGTDIEPQTQEIPYNARNSFLDRIKTDLYADFGALNVSNISASAVTATQINAAYQPLDENADDYEYQIIECVQNILRIAGLPEETPIFKRNRIANQNEEIQNVILEAPYLDSETILKKLPNISDDEVQQILVAKDAEEVNRYSPATDESAGVDDGQSTPANG